MTQKFSIEAQLEEVRLAISDYKYLAGQKQSLIDFRTNRLRSVCATLDWVQKNEAELRRWVDDQKNKRIVDEIHGAT